MSYEVRLIANAAIKALETRPTTFYESAFTLKDDQSGMEFWICNGFPFYGVYSPYKVNFGWWHGWRFSRALKKWRTAAVLNSKCFHDLV